MVDSRQDEQEVRTQLAQACRVLYMEGLADYNLGHASCRGPEADRVLIKPRGLGLEEITPDDVIVVDLEGNVVEGAHRPHGETIIHTGIYKRRPDVQSIVHVHPLFTAAFTSARLPIKRLNQDGVFFPGGVAMLESPELITTEQQAQALADKLGQDNAVLIRNHGIVTVGARIEEACLLAIFFERAVKLQLMASLFGEIVAISDETVWKMYDGFKQNPKRNEEIWRYMVRKLGREGLALQ